MTEDWMELLEKLREVGEVLEEITWWLEWARDEIDALAAGIIAQVEMDELKRALGLGLNLDLEFEDGSQLT